MSNDTYKFTRKLTAILSADVKGYSLLMADDEVFTIRTLKEYREIMFGLIQQHSGRVVDNPGDNLLAEFSSAVDAVETAVAIQKKLKKENAKFVEDKRLQFRIGVNIGEVVHDGDRIYGGGVNVAARIEGLANAGGVCISRGTYDQIKGKIDLQTEFLGEQKVKNINEPVRVYRVLLDTESHKSLVEEELELPENPSIAVLPFTNMSGDPSQEYFSDGLTEQIINGLCKVSNLFVIARNSSFAYKDKSISIKQIAQELGVKYVLEGSVQRAGDKVRITAQLIDAITDYHMWSDTFDHDLSDIFALQDEITMKLIGAMRINLTVGDQALHYKKEIKSIKASDKYFRGLEYFYQANKQANAQARKFFDQASKLEENSALMLAHIGYTFLWDCSFNWSDSPIKSFEEAEKYAQRALSLNASLDLPHSLMGMIHLYKKEYGRAILLSEQAVDLNPNGANVLASLGFIYCIAGKSKRAIRNLNKAFRLNPIPPPYYYHFIGVAYFLDRQYDKAVEILNQSLSISQESLTPYLVLTAIYIELNMIDEAKKSAKRLLEIDPIFSVEYHKNITPIKDQTELERYIGNLRKAGLPE